MDCRLKILSGPETGQEFHCAAAAQTLIGRSPRCAIRLSAPAISYEHALITRTGDEFFIENLSANGTTLNDDRLTAKTKLHVKDRIRMGPPGETETIARVEALPAAAAAGTSRRWLLIAVVLMLLGAMVVVIWDPFSSAAAAKDYAQTYLQLDQYVRDQVNAQRLDPQALSLLEDAWRLEKSSDHPAALTRWVKLRVLLSTSPAPLPEDQQRHQLLRFISQMQRHP